MFRALGKIRKAHGEADPDVRALGWGVGLAFLLACPALALIPLGAAAAIAATEGAADVTQAAVAARRKRREEGERKVREEQERLRREEERRRREAEERAKPQPPTKAEVRQARRELYFALLAEIDADPFMDPTEKVAAKEQARLNYVRELEPLL